MKKDYIKWIRSKVLHEKVILVFAGGCVFNDRGEILLQQRGDSNRWGFPGGAVELGETPEMAAIREFKEETGLDVKISELFGVYTDTDMRYPNGDQAQSISITYILEIIGGQLTMDQVETVGLRFFPLNETPELFCKQHQDFLNDLRKKYTI